MNENNVNNTINNSGFVAAPDIPPVMAVPNVSYEKKVPEYGKAELLLSPFCLIISFLFLRYTVCRVSSLITSLTYILIITVSIIYMKKKGYTFSPLNKVLSVVEYLFSTVFFITDNNFIKGLDEVFMVFTGAYLIYSVCADKKDVERYLPYALKSSVLAYPFSKFAVQANISSDKAKDSQTSSSIKKIILGLVITIPVTFVVALLLMDADDRMNDMLTGLFDGLLSDKFWEILFQGLFAIPFSFYLFGMLYSNTFRKDLNVLTDEECENRLFRKKAVSNLIFYSAAAPILILYVMFFVSQASYFLSAFMGRLPEEFSYAEYARKGFFELCWIVVINLGIMIIMNLHSSECGSTKTKVLKAYNIIFSVFTLILIATALSKMVMYIDTYGLTILRVYTTWFMVLCAFIFILVIVKQFKQDIHLSKWVSVGFTLMFALLCFSRPEAIIVRYNNSAGKVNKESFYYDMDVDSMSSDGLLEAYNEGLMTKEEINNIISDKFPRRLTDGLNLSDLILESKV